MMRSVSTKPDIKLLKTTKKLQASKKNHISDLRTPIRDTISETISFVIKGKLTPIKPFLLDKRNDLTVKKNVTKIPKVLKKSEDNLLYLRKLKEKNVKLDSKVQAKTCKKLSAESSCKKKFDKSPAKTISPNKVKLVNLSKLAKKNRDLNEKPKKNVKSVVTTKSAKCIPNKPSKNLPLKANTSEEISEAATLIDEDEIKKQQTIEQLLKQVNEEIKSKESRISKKSNKMKKRKKVVGGTIEEKVPAKPVQNPASDLANIIKPEVIESTENSEIKIDNEQSKIPEDTKNETVSNKEVDLESKEIKAELLVEEREQTLKKKKYVKLKSKPKITVIKKRVSSKSKSRADDQICKTKLFKFWNGPKRHRVASLNALAKVHCLYENETRATILDVIDESNKTAYNPKRDTSKNKSNKLEQVVKNEDLSEDSSPPPTRILRSVPGLRAIGKHWDMHDTTSSDEEDDVNYTVKSPTPEKVSQPKVKIKKEVVERKRRSNEIVMDLKDMVVRKRMASLNASAILAASYSAEKRHNRSKYSNDDTSSCSSHSSEEYFAALDKDIKIEEEDKKEDEPELIEVRATPNKKVAVILNQDTDVTITGVYVNSTTRSTHHEGYCSIAGMQYRISATSHTQTAATAVSTEALLQSSSNSVPDNSNSDSMPSSKSYTPLDALSNMQPPPGPGLQHNHPVLHGQQHMGPPQHVIGMPPHQLSPGLRHSCSSAFSSPHSTPSYQTPPSHHPPIQGDAGYVHAGYYQPAGPLITVPPPHGHSQPPHPPLPPLTKTIPPPPETSPSSSTTPSVIPHDGPPPPPSSAGDSSDSEVIITSVTTAKDPVPPPSHPPAAYRYQYPGYSYSYPPHSYPYPTPPNPPYSHHDMCYSPNPYVHKYPIRRYLTTQYYPPPNPSDIYPVPPSGPSQPSQQVVTAPPASANATTYSAAPPTLLETYASPQPALVEGYQPPPPSHYYPPPAAFGPPAPTCYSHPSSRAIPYINAYQSSCPCPMQSCPKNVHTGPLTGDCKRSNISNESMPLPPVALALPLEPASATGPPSPARGSAGMPPPPSPAGATYQAPPPVPTKQESDLVNNQEQCKTEKKRKARIGKAMVRNNIAANLQQNTMLLMCGNSQDFVKREIESPQEQVAEEKREITDGEGKKFLENLQHPCTKIEEMKQEESQPEISVQPKEETIIEEPQKDPLNPLPPVINTVAENVKVKNMKRKLSMLSEKEPSPEVVPVEKKQKCGSYKLLIKKETNTVRINNGKRKLLGEMSQLSKARETKLKLRKRTNKTLNNGNTIKRQKFSKLTQTNNSNCKSGFHPSTKTKEKKLLSVNKVNSKSISAPEDKTLAKNNIERTIESVISVVCLRTREENTAKTEKCGKQQTNKPVINKKSTNKGVVSKKFKTNSKKTEITRRKSKCSEIAVTPIKKPLNVPKWSNGWTWEGEPFEAKVFLNSDELTILRRCYPAMRHEGGDKIAPKDCVLLKAGPRKNDLPFVAKIAALWENPEDGEMMMSLLWYYRPEHTEQGRLPIDQPDEVFASRHKDSNSVACIDDKCYVLTFNEYCRYRKTYKRIESGIEESLPCIPNPEPYPRYHMQPPMTLVSPEMVFFCRRVYDFRQKRMVKNPT
ncbi:uncharacterized protein LOC130449310 [Diorhabda sublineata]|uniref:uncharacterized protein LOC130449310 n=1 Tax=Diorhabda sublineata TaxID=1163346 RepID=UPI0024E0EAA2|nr:uncharacterized protein LOC130449310 [Diorhabda sublineata]XP_056643023.1 uncharacterized protein LOC130449310 [Diorhabda sublineata]